MVFEDEISKYIKQIEEWVDNNHHAEKSEYDNKMSELDTKFKEFVSKFQTDTAEGSVDEPIVDEPGPQIEEID